MWHVYELSNDVIANSKKKTAYSEFHRRSSDTESDKW